MTQLVIPMDRGDRTGVESHMRVNVHIQAEVLAPEVARRKANTWLLMNAGNLLGAEEPELVLGEQLAWRVEVMLTSPTRGCVGRIGRLHLDAVTGDVLDPDTSIEDLIANAGALAAS